MACEAMGVIGGAMLFPIPVPHVVVCADTGNSPGASVRAGH